MKATNNTEPQSEALFQKIHTHLLQDEKPSDFLNQISEDPEFKKHPFQLLLKLKETKQSPKHHPEGSVWNHTMLAVDEAAKRRKSVKNGKAFMWAALLHDIGKPCTTRIRKGRITSYDHDKAGGDLARQFLSAFDLDEDMIAYTAALVRWHMQILFVVKDLPFANIPSMKSETDIHDVAILGLCDRMGRKGADADSEQENIRLFIEKCK